eukprot:8805-Heterococcus_DN1.PRE.3
MSYHVTSAARKTPQDVFQLTELIVTTWTLAPCIVKSKLVFAFVVCVSDAFEGKSLIARHRMVNDLLKEELEGTLHALSIQPKTPSQWESEGHKIIPSPACMGGSK